MEEKNGGHKRYLNVGRLVEQDGGENGGYSKYLENEGFVELGGVIVYEEALKINKK